MIGLVLELAIELGGIYSISVPNPFADVIDADKVFTNQDLLQVVDTLLADGGRSLPAAKRKAVAKARSVQGTNGVLDVLVESCLEHLNE